MAALGSTPLGAGDLISDLGENLLLPERPLRVALSGSVRQLSVSQQVENIFNHHRDGVEAANVDSRRSEVSLVLPLEDRVRQQIELNLASGVYVYHFEAGGKSSPDDFCSSGSLAATRIDDCAST